MKDCATPFSENSPFAVEPSSALPDQVGIKYRLKHPEEMVLGRQVFDQQQLVLALRVSVLPKRRIHHRQMLLMLPLYNKIRAPGRGYPDFVFNLRRRECRRRLLNGEPGVDADFAVRVRHG